MRQARNPEARRKAQPNNVPPFLLTSTLTTAARFRQNCLQWPSGSDLRTLKANAAGFTPRVRQEVLRGFRGLEIVECPFANLSESKGGRWGQGLTEAKMEECRWLKPVLVGQFEFTGWTPDNHLRYSRFVALRDDKKLKDLRREG